MADPVGRIDAAGRQIAGLLGYNPGPGIYSRLERAVEGMPANVRAQELPGLLKRYKEGVPGWELRATDLDSTIAGRDVVPRDELLAAVRERSPVHTHGEIVLGGTPQQRVVIERFARPGESPITTLTPEYGGVGKLGEGRPAGLPGYKTYGQGGSDYTELLLTQPGNIGSSYGNHWTGVVAPSPMTRAAAENNAVAHARFDTHGDALRINELQSDLGIHNRKMRERAGQPQGPAGWDNTATPTGTQELPFPLEDAWAEILIKRLALEAARKGHRAIEVASPRAIADKVGGNIDNYEHFYGKVVPGAIERLGRKMGGLIEDTAAGVEPTVLSLAESEQALARGMQAQAEAQQLYVQALKDRIPGIDIPRPGNSEAYVGHISRPLVDVAEPPVGDRLRYAESLRDSIARLHNAQTGRDISEGVEFANSLMPQMMRQADELRAGRAWDNATGNMYRTLDQRAWVERPPRRYIMSDEMRRNLIEKGVGASLLAPLLMQGEE